MGCLIPDAHLLPTLRCIDALKEGRSAVPNCAQSSPHPCAVLLRHLCGCKKSGCAVDLENGCRLSSLPPQSLILFRRPATHLPCAFMTAMEVRYLASASLRIARSREVGKPHVILVAHTTSELGPTPVMFRYGDVGIGRFPVSVNPVSQALAPTDRP